jgi:hypothetical protein
MKNLIKTLLRESLLDEAAFNINHLPEDAALFVTKKGVGLTLYDPKTNNVYATLGSSLRNSELGYDVDNVAAEKGFGPFIYELAMMHANIRRKGLMPNRSGDIRTEALNVWEKFYMRTDVEKKTIEPILPNGEFNTNYRVDILTGDEYTFSGYDDFMSYFNELDDNQKKILAVFNTIYSMKPNTQYETLIQRGKDYQTKGFNPSKAISIGSKYFNSKYD